MKEKLQEYVGSDNSPHNKARIKFEAFINQEKDIRIVFDFFYEQGFAFRGHDEFEDSNNQGNFLEPLNFLADHNDEIKAVAFKNAFENLKLTSPDIQKDIISVATFEIINVIINKIGDGLFSILVDESRDISVKEQMSIILRYVNKKGCVVERFVGIEHVLSTTAFLLKDVIDSLFSRYKLSISSLRGQGYDGVSNMQVVANKHVEIETFFDLIDRVVNVVGGSAKRGDFLREKQRLQILEALSHGEMSSERGLNQQTTLKHSGDTRWSSHYGSLLNLINMFSPITDDLEMIANDVPSSGKIGETRNLLSLIITFDFAFSLRLMKKILGMLNELSKTIKRKIKILLMP
ncbi:uncharacterized protein LOC127790915 [Diospyros lotus]|uniref:uncharacterized protein LOC127790915 n=1 Tax=Diospyros lotus TaxID=55363 RepID=UPI0022508E23|nr:uncharacterized protein LOC127790915 [Diospyros lotus]